MARRCAGISVPVFSLKTKRSLGCGDFLDLIPLIDYANVSGFKILQLLPVNDTSITETSRDKSPYSILSAFALHPIYINIQELAFNFDFEVFAPLIKKLNFPQFEYSRIYHAKKEILKKLFIVRGEKDLKSTSFIKFFEDSKEFLKPYAAFCALRDHYNTSDFSNWDKSCAYSELLVEEVCKKYKVDFFYFVQFHLHRQMRKVVAHAKKKKILLKGDFPIGVHPHSVEAWRFHNYFRWEQQVGAPPDFYNNSGQNWGFPSYDWDEIKEEGFFWLKSRLQWMERYFKIIRLDHILGYFRLWEIPIRERSGLMGSFYPSLGYSEEEIQLTSLNLRSLNKFFFFRNKTYHPRINLIHLKDFDQLNFCQKKIIKQFYKSYFFQRQDSLWKLEGIEKLKVMLNVTKIELCAEDIGVVPNCVNQVLKELNILNLHVQRMPKSFEIEFENPQDFPESCVCMPSNHDTAPLRQWWVENPKKTRKYYYEILKKEGNPPEELTSSLAKEIIEQHLKSRARYAIFLIQDIMAMNEQLCHPRPDFERINDPAQAEDQWNYRMHLYIEELLLNSSFSSDIRQMILEAKR